MILECQFRLVLFGNAVIAYCMNETQTMAVPAICQVVVLAGLWTLSQHRDHELRESKKAVEKYIAKEMDEIEGLEPSKPAAKATMAEASGTSAMQSVPGIDEVNEEDEGDDSTPVNQQTFAEHSESQPQPQKTVPEAKLYFSEEHIDRPMPEETKKEDDTKKPEEKKSDPAAGTEAKDDIEAKLNLLVDNIK